MEKVPADLSKALAGSAKAQAAWKTLTPISHRDFIRWVTSAKQEETRKKRIKVSIDKLLKGERRPCCYSIVPMKFYKALGESAKAKATWRELTPDDRRDFVDWMETPKAPAEFEKRIGKAISLLAAGKHHP